MRTISPDAFLHAYRHPKATFECLRSFRKFNPDAMVTLISDGGEDFSAIADYFGCHYEYCHNLGMSPWNEPKLREWLDRFVRAVKRQRAEFLLLLEDDVYIRGPIRRSPRFAIAGPWHRSQLSGRLFDFLRRRWPHLTASNYGGCGGTLFHRETFLECAEAFDFSMMATYAELDSRVWYSDVFLTLMFLSAGHPYSSAQDVHCEVTPNSDWETNGRPILHQYKRYYGQALAPEDLALLSAAIRPAPTTAISLHKAS